VAEEADEAAEARGRHRFPGEHGAELGRKPRQPSARVATIVAGDVPAAASASWKAYSEESSAARTH
jgi:hypothetical protein